MSESVLTDWQSIIARAKLGDQQALAQLLEVYRNYLRLLARVHVDTNLQAKADPSDLVQETFLQAVRDFPRFRGETEGEFVAWLRRILANTGVAMIRKFKEAQLRDVNRERRFDDRLAQSSAALDRLLVARDDTPSHIASRREGAVVLADALAKLPDDYREVLVLHHLEGLAVADVAQRMGRTAGAVKGIRTRAVLKLRSLLKERPQ